MIKFEIKNRSTGAVQVAAEVECDDDAVYHVKLGLAVQWAVKNKANLRGADLRDASLDGADLRWANLGGADLRRANLRCANLRLTNLSDVSLRYADLSGADLGGACLSGVDLHLADLNKSYLGGAKGIVSFGPVGKERRIGYAVSHNDGPRIQLGCFWGTLDEACVAIALKYGPYSSYEQIVRAACAVLDDSKGA